MNVGKALKYYRINADMTQVQVAELSDVNDKYYGNIERNESSPTLNRLEQICNAIGVSLYQIVTFDPTIEYAVIDYDNICENTLKQNQNNKIECYCNCCGTTFWANNLNIVCPQCSCEFSSNNSFIECCN